MPAGSHQRDDYRDNNKIVRKNDDVSAENAQYQRIERGTALLDDIVKLNETITRFRKLQRNIGPDNLSYGKKR